MSEEQQVDNKPPEGRRLYFFAAPYMLKLKFNQGLIPVQLTNENAGKNLLWQRTYGAYLCKLKKANYGEHFTGIEEEEQDALVVPIDGVPDM